MQLAFFASTRTLKLIISADKDISNGSDEMELDWLGKTCQNFSILAVKLILLRRKDSSRHSCLNFITNQRKFFMTNNSLHETELI